MNHISEKVIEIESKRLIIRKAPATVAYDVALRYRACLARDDSKAMQEMQDCLYVLLRYVHLDLGDGRTVALDNKEIINQHFTQAQSLLQLQRETTAFNFDFLAKDAVSGS